MIRQSLDSVLGTADEVIGDLCDVKGLMWTLRGKQSFHWGFLGRVVDNTSTLRFHFLVCPAGSRHLCRVQQWKHAAHINAHKHLLQHINISLKYTETHIICKHVNSMNKYIKAILWQLCNAHTYRTLSDLLRLLSDSVHDFYKTEQL